MTELMPLQQAQGIARAVCEALLGLRALHQIRPCLTPEAFRQLTRYVDASRYWPAQTGRVRVQSPTPGVAEAVSIIRLGRRWQALCLRLERDDEWVCSELTLVGFRA